MSRNKGFIKLATDLNSFFTEEIAETAAKQGIKVTEPVTRYLGSVLTRFSDSDQFLLNTSDESLKKEFPLLAKIWSESLSAPMTEQYFALQKLGDVALFVTGFFKEKITHQRSLIDMDYYRAMGEMAYQRAGHIKESIQAERALNVFFELSEGFKAYEELFAEINDKKLLQNDKDILKLYEKWLASGSQRISRMLGEAGIIPSRGPSSGEPLS
jgi:hypothetical protein